MILRWNHTAQNHDNFGYTLALKFSHNFRNQRAVCSRLRGYADDMDIIFNRLAYCISRRLKQWTDINVETQVGKRRSYYASSSIMSILAQFCHQ